ncbi:MULTISPECIES: thioesterase family protein [Corallococcus]|uniref:acyl-CoA thioesterase n=1 Tax=Corallococcus TaxID=83461 RepID=UPI00117D8169|nr:MULTISPECIES: acyl-CoA thioesterase [Corallococcus]NBD10911.1 acyl-CoA thioesterase [Corallococcus silvisoli]TSC31653.1 acyl-CoA thioesterase [Corallococcus sp. Z5C101001]
MHFEESSLTLRVRPNDLDTLGHVNNATVLEYLEAGRWAWLERQGLKRGAAVVAVVSRVEVDYRREIPPGDVRVHTVLESPAEDELDVEGLNYRARFRQRVFLSGDGPLAVEAVVSVAFLDARTRSLASLQQFLAAAGGPVVPSEESRP